MLQEEDLTMIKKLNIKDTEVAKCVLELQLVSYKIEADIIGFQEIPPLKDTIDSLKRCGEIFYGYYMNDVLAGIISYKIIETVLDIHRVAVHPLFFRKGIASKLIDFIEELGINIIKVIVCTGKDNLPAVTFYLSKGYKSIKDFEISKGIYITEFEKIIF